MPTEFQFTQLTMADGYTPSVDQDVATKVYVDGVAGAAPAGSIIAFGGTSAPTGWLLCDGSPVSRTLYAALFTAIGIAYGAGDGSTTFNLPNGQAMFLRGTGTQSVGGISHSGPTLGTTQNDAMQGHVHQSQGAQGGSSGPNFTAYIQNLLGSPISASGPVDDGTNGTPRVAGETRPVNLGVNFIIKT